MAVGDSLYRRVTNLSQDYLFNHGIAYSKIIFMALTYINVDSRL